MPNLLEYCILTQEHKRSRCCDVEAQRRVSCVLLAMSKMLTVLVALFSILSVALLYRAASESAISLSPQGCRMSYMSPSYLVQSQFDASWTPLAKRYSLLLYREVGWEDNEVSCFHSHLLLPHGPCSPAAFPSFSSPEMQGLLTRSVR